MGLAGTTTTATASKQRDGVRANLKKKKKQREELSPERIRELTTTTRTRPFDERRRPPPPRKFIEVDNTDPNFDFERIPDRGRPFFASDYEDFGVSAPLIESPLSVGVDEYGEDEQDPEAPFFIEETSGERITPTSTTLRTDLKQFADIRDKFETARQEITTEFSHFSNKPPVEGNYMVIRMGDTDLGHDPTNPDHGSSGRGTAVHPGGRDSRFQRPPPPPEGSSSTSPHHRDVFNFSLPDEPVFPNSLQAVVHHNPFRHNFEQLNRSLTDPGGDNGAYGYRIGTAMPVGGSSYPEDPAIRADLPAEDPWRLDLDVNLEQPQAAVVTDRYEEYYQRRQPVAVRTSQLSGPPHVQYGHHLVPGNSL